jgi:hypothetical protein
MFVSILLLIFGKKIATNLNPSNLYLLKFISLQIFFTNLQFIVLGNKQKNSQ